MFEVILWVFAIYGGVSLFFYFWVTIISKRKENRWTLVYLAFDPNRVEGELRSLLLELFGKNIYPGRLIVLWQNQDYELANKISEKFPGVELVNMGKKAFLEDFMGPEKNRKVLIFGGGLDIWT